jgi:tetratricopeptide (TPR) repeat protein
MPGLDVNIRNEGGGTPLHSAAAHGRSAAVEALLAADAIPSLTDSAGDTPAHAAWRRGHRHTEGLIDRGALAPAVRWDSPGVGARPGGWEEAKAAGNAAFAKGSVPCLRRAVWSYTDAFLLLALTGQAEAESSRGQREHASLERQELTTKRSEAGSLPGLERTASFGGQELLPATVKQAAAEGLPSREEPDSLGLQQQEAVLRSNRSAAHARLSQFALSLEDADAAVALRPEWGKGHGRRGAALAGLGRWREAEAAYRDGLQVSQNRPLLKQFGDRTVIK